ncbi:MAG: hypothetical protein IKO61_01425 [Lachnospiraceae bacterium]|nr:hypothetical protein [Lachnospiraceae bacterium]
MPLIGVRRANGDRLQEGKVDYMKKLMTYILSVVMIIAACFAANVPARAAGGKSIGDMAIYLSATELEYNGTLRKPQVTVKDDIWILEEDKDYKLKYENSVNAGKYKLTVTGMGDYSGSKTFSYTITPTALYSSWVNLSKTSYTYDGKAKKPAVTVNTGKATLVEGKDYTVTYKNNVVIGAYTAKVVVEGIGNYRETVTKSFSIEPPKSADTSVTLKYRAYVQKKNWMDWTVAGVGTKVDQTSFAGTTDNLRMETIQMQLSGASGAVKYRAYVEKMGWTQWATTANTTTYAGTKGMSRRVEMIQLQTTGMVGMLYDMYYRTYCETFGWLGWAGNNEKSGSAGYARKLEAFQIQFVPKGTKFERGTRKAFYDKTKDGANP